MYAVGDFNTAAFLSGLCPIQDELAERTAGYCGADMKALCAEATLLAVRRQAPHDYSLVLLM